MPNQRYTPNYTPSVSRGAIAGAFVNPYDDVLSAVERGAEKVAGNLAEDVAQERVFSGEQTTLGPALTDVQRRYYDAAKAAMQAQTETQIRTKVAELGAKYPGRTKADLDGFQTEFNDFASALEGSADPSLRGRVKFELDTRRGLAVASLTDSINQHELKRSADAIELGWKQDVDDAASAAQIGRDDLVDLSLARATEKQQQLVALGLIAPETAALNDRTGREEVATRTLFRGFLEGQVSLEDIRDGDVGAGLSATARDRLVNRVQGEINDRRENENRANAVRAAGVRERTYVAKAIAGKQKVNAKLTREEAAFKDQVQSGNPEFQVDPDALDVLNANDRRAIDTALITGMPLGLAEAYLANREQEGAGTEEEGKALDELRDSLRAHRSGLTGSDSTQYLMDRGSLSDPDKPGPPPPIDFSSPDALAASLADRSRRIGAAEAQYRERFPALTNAETDQLRGALDRALLNSQTDPDGVVNILGALTRTLGKERAQATLGKLAESGGRGYAIAGAALQEVGIDVARDIAAAQTLDEKQKTALLKPEGTSATYRADFEAAAGSAMRDSPGDREAWLSAATDLYAARAFRSGSKYDAKEFKRAVHDAVGGVAEITTGGWLGGQTSTVPNPKGYDWEGRVSDLTGNDILRLGGTNLPLPPDEVADLIRSTGTFRYDPEGLRIDLELDGGKVELTRPDGRPFVLVP